MLDWMMDIAAMTIGALCVAAFLFGLAAARRRRRQQVANSIRDRPARPDWLERRKEDLGP